MSLAAVELRRLIHRNPELSFREFSTTRAIEENLAANGAFRIKKPLETGLLVEYRAGSGPFSLFRADIDALPIKEETGALFASANQNMHACGHDVHAAILYGTALACAAGGIKRNLLFLFQPGEESGGGAKKLLDSGALKEYDIKNAFALHVTDEFAEGAVASSQSLLFACAREVDLIIKGRAAHIAFPQNGVNAFDALRSFLDFVDRSPRNNSDPFIFGYGKVESGSVRNVVPDRAKLEASLRTLSVERSEEHYGRFRKLLDAISAAKGIEYELRTGSFYPEVKCERELFHKIAPRLAKKFDFHECGYKMTGEDFGFISREYPSFMFWLGTQNGEHRHGLHSPKFMPEDSAVEKGIAAFLEIIDATGRSAKTKQ